MLAQIQGGIFTVMALCSETCAVVSAAQDAKMLSQEGDTMGSTIDAWSETCGGSRLCCTRWQDGLTRSALFSLVVRVASAVQDAFSTR